MRTLPVVECYRAAKYFSVLNDFDKNVSKAINNIWGDNVDYSDIIKNVSVALDQVHLPYFVTEFECWYKKITIQNTKIFLRLQKVIGFQR